MLTCYPGGGARYIRHVDNGNRNGRKLTAILYLNPHWKEGDGKDIEQAQDKGRGRAGDTITISVPLSLILWGMSFIDPPRNLNFVSCPLLLCAIWCRWGVACVQRCG